MQVLTWRCKKKSAKQVSDENADLQAKEKSAKQLPEENADFITIKYWFQYLILNNS